MKKIVAMVLCLVMVLGLMTGCQKAMDLKTLTQKMDEAMAAADGMAGKANLELDFQLAMSGMTMGMGMDLALEMKAQMDMSSAWMDVDMSMDVLGESQDMDMEIYMNADGDDMVMYMLEGTTNTWIKTQETGYTELAAQSQDSAIKFSQMPQEQMTLAEEKETVDGRACYVLQVNMDGEYFQTAMESAMMMAADDATKEMMETMDWSKLSTSMVWYVDAETFLPVQMTGEIQGLGDLMGGMVDTLLGAEAAGMEMSVTVPNCKIAMTEMDYTGVEVPAVPQEAIDNAIDADEMAEEPVVGLENGLVENPPQADGSYLLSLESDSVSIILPGSYPYVDAGVDYLDAVNEEGTMYLSYMLVPDVTGEDMRLGVMNEIDWANQNSYYKSHSDVAELEGYSTMSLIYNDGTSIWYAWKELEGCVLLMAAELEGETYDLTELIASVQIAAE